MLDDCSSDDSILVIMKLAEERQRDLSLVINEQNSGSVFAQWEKAAEMAEGEFLWIAEADDLSEPTFLSSLIGLLKGNPDIALGFTESNAIDGEELHLCASCNPIAPAWNPERWRAPRCSQERTLLRAISGQEHHPQCHRCYGVGRRCWMR